MNILKKCINIVVFCLELQSHKYGSDADDQGLSLWSKTLFCNVLNKKNQYMFFHFWTQYLQSLGFNTCPKITPVSGHGLYHRQGQYHIDDEI